MSTAKAENTTITILDAIAPDRERYGTLVAANDIQGPRPTLAAAYAMCRPIAAAGNPDEAVRQLSRLLWHVEAKDGGFLGLSDRALAKKCAADRRLDYCGAVAAVNTPGAFAIEVKP